MFWKVCRVLLPLHGLLLFQTLALTAAAEESPFVFLPHGCLTGVDSNQAFGYDVALSHDGNTFVTGYLAANGTSTQMFVRSEAGPRLWSQEGSTLPGAGACNRNCHDGNEGITMSSDGSVATVLGNGSALVLARTNGLWALEDEITIGCDINDAAVSADGGTMVVTSLGGCGCIAVVYNRNHSSDGNWTRQANITLSNCMGMDAPRIALSASSSNLTMLIGVSGSAQVFSRSGDGMWSSQGMLLTTVVGGTQSAVALSGNGNVAVLGDFQYPPFLKGAAVVFDRTDGVWSKSAVLQGSGPATNQGVSVTISDDGTLLAFTSWGSSPTAWIFQRSNQGIWSQVGVPIVGLGQHVALSGDGSVLIVSDARFLPTNTHSGELCIFTRELVTFTPTMSPTIRPPNTGDQALLVAYVVGGGLGGILVLAMAAVSTYLALRRRRYEAVAVKTPATMAFLTHEWGADPKHRNHVRVTLINAELKKQRIVTWFDSDRLTGDVTSQIVAGIDKTEFVILFLTKRYMEKVGKITSKDVDFCQMEFHYAMRRKGKDHFIVVVMEPDLLDQENWFGPVGALLGGSLYVDFSNDDRIDLATNAIVAELDKRFANSRINSNAIVPALADDA